MDDIVSHYVAKISETLQRIFNNHIISHHIPFQFKPNNTLRKKVVNPKYKAPRHKQTNVVYAV